MFRPGKYLNMCSITAVALAATKSGFNLPTFRMITLCHESSKMGNAQFSSKTNKEE